MLDSTVPVQQEVQLLPVVDDHLAVHPTTADLQDTLDSVHLGGMYMGKVIFKNHYSNSIVMHSISCGKLFYLKFLTQYSASNIVAHESQQNSVLAEQTETEMSAFGEIPIIVRSGSFPCDYLR